MSLVPSWSFTVVRFSETHKTSLPVADTTAGCENPRLHPGDVTRRAPEAPFPTSWQGSLQGSRVLLSVPHKVGEIDASPLK